MTKNKLALITGASSGLGSQLAVQLAKQSYDLILVARRLDKLQEVAATCLDYGVKVETIKADMSVQEDLQTVVNAVDKIDLLINNAGYGLFKEAEAFDYATIDDMIKVNMLAPIKLTIALLPKFYQQQAGHIIFVASQSSKIATPKTSIYSASKFGIRGFANALRLEVKKKGIHVTTVNPGPIATPFFSIADEAGKYISSVKQYMLTTEEVVNRILKAIHKPVREVNIPFKMHISSVLSEVFPNISDRLITKLFDLK